MYMTVKKVDFDAMVHSAWFKNGRTITWDEYELERMEVFEGVKFSAQEWKEARNSKPMTLTEYDTMINIDTEA